MSGWRYLATRLNGDGTEDLLEPELPLDGVSLTATLSGRDELTASVPVEVPRLMRSGLGLFVPWRTAIYAEKDGQIRLGCILTDAPRAQQKLELTATGFVGYLDALPHEGAVHNYKSADPFAIASTIWADVQARRGGDLGVSVQRIGRANPVRLGKAKDKDDPDAGPWAVNYWDTLDLGSRWDDLATDGSFDYRERHAWQGEKITHTVQLGYPGLGKRRDDLRFAVGENVADLPTVEQKGEDYADAVIVLGAGEGRDMVRGQATHGVGTRLHRPKIVTDKTIKTKAAANKRARQEIAYLHGNGRITSLTVRDHPNARLGTYAPGDWITVIGNGTGWAGDLAMTVRILSYEISPGDSDDAVLTVTTDDGDLPA